jgi:glycosyltransferase involved in cell wall biosynthesis
MSKVTIGIPVIKTQYLLEAIQSCLQQTFTDYELIIFNNSNVPEARSKIEKIVSGFTDSRINYITKWQSGWVIQDWNAVLQKATGEYFVLFSDDDILEPEYLDELVTLADKYPSTDVFHCRVRIIDENSVFLNYSSSCPEWESVYNFMWHRMNSFRTHYIPEFFCRTSALKKIGGYVDFPLAWCSDDATWYTLAKGNGIGYCDKPLCNWRNSKINISKVGNIVSRFQAVILFDAWQVNFLSQLDPKNRQERELINGIEKKRKPWFENAKALLLASEIKPQLLIGSVQLFFRWLRLRKRYEISFIALVKANIMVLNKS